MVKGISIKFKSYSETIPRLLEVVHLDRELKKHNTIVLKVSLRDDDFLSSDNTPVAFAEEVLKYCINNKNPSTEIFIVEGAESDDTTELFENLGYKKLAEQYNVGLVDLNDTETEEVNSVKFSRFEQVIFPKILKDSFVISLPTLSEDYETGVYGSLASMIGAFPKKHYKSFLSRIKNKIRNWPIEYSIHDVSVCKMPNFAIADTSSKGIILAGLPLEIDKQLAKLLGKEWKQVKHLKFIDESLAQMPTEKKKEEIVQ